MALQQYPTFGQGGFGNAMLGAKPQQPMPGQMLHDPVANQFGGAGVMKRADGRTVFTSGPPLPFVAPATNAKSIEEWQAKEALRRSQPTQLVRPSNGWDDNGQPLPAVGAAGAIGATGMMTKPTVASPIGGSAAGVSAAAPVNPFLAMTGLPDPNAGRNTPIGAADYTRRLRAMNRASQRDWGGPQNFMQAMATGGQYQLGQQGLANQLTLGKGDQSTRLAESADRLKGVDLTSGRGLEGSLASTAASRDVGMRGYDVARAGQVTAAEIAKADRDARAAQQLPASVKAQMDLLNAVAQGGAVSGDQAIQLAQQGANLVSGKAGGLDFSGLKTGESIRPQDVAGLDKEAKVKAYHTYLQQNPLLRPDIAAQVMSQMGLSHEDIASATMGSRFSMAPGSGSAGGKFLDALLGRDVAARANRKRQRDLGNVPGVREYLPEPTIQ